jgi:hypothetical protein
MQIELEYPPCGFGRSNITPVDVCLDFIAVNLHGRSITAFMDILEQDLPSLRQLT